MKIKKIKSFLSDNTINNCHISVAVSGGADSVFLLYALNALREEFELDLSICHVNYNLRGSESIYEQAYVEGIAKDLDIPFYGKEVTGLSLDSPSLEEKARDIRYAFFEELKGLKLIEYIALAHTMNDQAETLLFRLIRGTGVTGAAGMSAIRDGSYIRPMLSVSRLEVEQSLQESGIEWCEDSSNRDNFYSRNMLRNKVIPELLGIHSASIEHLSAFSKKMNTLQKGIKVLYKQWKEKHIEYESDFSLVIDSRETPPLLDDFLVLLLDERGISAATVHIEALKTYWLKSGKELLLPNGYHVLTLGDRLIIKKRASDEFQFGEQSIVVRSTFHYNSPLFSFSLKNLSDTSLSLIIRTAKAEDVIALSRSCKAQSVVKILKDEKITFWLRKHYPVVCTSTGEIVALPCRGIASSWKKHIQFT